MTDLRCEPPCVRSEGSFKSPDTQPWRSAVRFLRLARTLCMALSEARVLRARAPLDNGDIDPCQHQPRRTSSTITTAWLVIATLRSSPRRPTRPRATRTSTTTHAFHDPVGSGFGPRFYGMTRVLKQVPCAPRVRLEGSGVQSRQSGARGGDRPPPYSRSGRAW